MKPKIGFRELLLSFRKRLKEKTTQSNFIKDPELYYAVALVIVWLLIFIIIHLKF
ncbi:MAG: hypothetical protein JWP78_2702 [Mucilaginibacter sp.]|nr:hypothetical protein [Mucilaginibacter sp.]